MDYVKKFLKSIDILGETPQLYMNETTQFKKELGGIISILYLIIAVAAFIIFGQELWQKKNPTVNQSTIYDPSPAAMQIDFDRLDFFLKLQDPFNNGFINESIYSVRAFIYSVLSNGTSISTPIDIEPCRNSSFTPENLALFYPYNFNNTCCVSRNQSNIAQEEIRIQGSFGQLGFHMLIFKF